MWMKLLNFSYIWGHFEDLSFEKTSQETRNDNINKKIEKILTIRFGVSNYECIANILVHSVEVGGKNS
jgi:hypothetical protein